MKWILLILFSVYWCNWGANLRGSKSKKNFIYLASKMILTSCMVGGTAKGRIFWKDLQTVLPVSR